MNPGRTLVILVDGTRLTLWKLDEPNPMLSWAPEMSAALRLSEFAMMCRRLLIKEQLERLFLVGKGEMKYRLKNHPLFPSHLRTLLVPEWENIIEFSDTHHPHLFATLKRDIQDNLNSREVWQGSPLHISDQYGSHLQLSNSHNNNKTDRDL